MQTHLWLRRIRSYHVYHFPSYKSLTWFQNSASQSGAADFEGLVRGGAQADTHKDFDLFVVFDQSPKLLSGFVHLDADFLVSRMHR